MRFSHSLHLPEERRTLGKSCEGCHVRKAEARQFEPISFDAHCAACHVKNNALDQIRTRTERPHRDAATIEQASALSRLIDPSARDTERASVVERAAEADRLLAGEPGASAGPERTAARSELAREWAARGITLVEPKSSPRDAGDREAAQSILSGVQRRLAQLDAEPRALPSPPSQDAAPAALTTTLGACLACHEVDGAAMRPVASARPVLNPVFNHAPHVGAQRLTCESCHDTIDRSGTATEVNLPHVAKCQSCHGSTPAAPTGCTSCHQYHRSLSGRLAAWTPAGSF